MLTRTDRGLALDRREMIEAPYPSTSLMVSSMLQKVGGSTSSAFLRTRLSESIGSSKIESEETSTGEIGLSSSLSRSLSSSFGYSLTVLLLR